MRRSLTKPLVFAACSLPLAWLALRTFGIAGLGLGANPVSELIHRLGSWGLRFLLLTLCVTPLSVSLRKPKLMQYRRMLGLFAFTFLVLHFLAWLVLDQWLKLSAILADIVKRPYITIGFAALLMLVPLAVTSTRGWMRRLGRRWHELHRLIYPAAVLGCMHFWWQVKRDIREPLLYACGLAVLLAYRAVKARRACARLSAAPFAATDGA